MTGIFFYQPKKLPATFERISQIAQDISHRGKYRTQIINTSAYFTAVYLNGVQKDNLVAVDDPLRDGAQIIAVMDGKIDNVAELSALVGGPGVRTGNGVETAWELYKLHGIEAFSKISGQYAMVIKSGDQTIAARDPVGSNPLYYYDDDEQLVISSEIRAFRELGKTPRALEPGTALWTDGHSMRIQRFFDPRGLVHDEKARVTDETRAAAQLYALLGSAVKRSIPPDAKIAALLSGGIDSSIICALALQTLPTLEAHVVAYAGSEDLVYARKFSDYYQGRVNLHVIPYTLDDLLRVIPDVIRSLESFDAALIRSAMPMHLACSNIPVGTDILLTGEGSDELFGGYSYLEGISPDKLDEELLALLNVEHATGLQRVDRIPYHFGIEARAPWFDLDIVRYSFTLPVRMKIRHGPDGIIEKWITREAFKNLLPAEITWRKKAKFSQGAGSELVMRDHLAKEISDAEYSSEKEIAPGVFARSKEELFYWRVFKEYFNPTDEFIMQMPRTGQYTV